MDGFPFSTKLMNQDFHGGTFWKLRCENSSVYIIAKQGIESCPPCVCSDTAAAAIAFQDWRWCQIQTEVHQAYGLYQRPILNNAKSLTLDHCVKFRRAAHQHVRNHADRPRPLAGFFAASEPKASSVCYLRLAIADERIILDALSIFGFLFFPSRKKQCQWREN